MSPTAPYLVPIWDSIKGNEIHSPKLTIDRTN